MVTKEQALQAMPEMLMNYAMEEVFPKLWKDKKEEFKDMSKKDLAELYALALKVVPTADLASQALNIALAHRLNGYDAFYVALSAQVNAPLITADEKLVAAMKGKAYHVHWLGDFPIPPIPTAEQP